MYLPELAGARPKVKLPPGTGASEMRWAVAVLVDFSVAEIFNPDQ